MKHTFQNISRIQYYRHYSDETSSKAFVFLIKSIVYSFIYFGSDDDDEITCQIEEILYQNMTPFWMQ